MAKTTNPPASHSQPRTRRKHLRLTFAEVKTITSKAQEAGLTFSEYVRRTALTAKITAKVSPELRRQAIAVLRQLSTEQQPNPATATLLTSLQKLLQ